MSALLAPRKGESRMNATPADSATAHPMSPGVGSVGDQTMQASLAVQRCAWYASEIARLRDDCARYVLTYAEIRARLDAMLDRVS